MTLVLQLCIVIICIVCSVVFSDDSFRPYESEDGERVRNGGRERYRYRNGRGNAGSNEGSPRGQRKGQAEDDNLNPFFPPRTDAFWEAEKQTRGEIYET